MAPPYPAVKRINLYRNYKRHINKKERNSFVESAHILKNPPS